MVKEELVSVSSLGFSKGISDVKLSLKRIILAGVKSLIEGLFFME